MEEAEHVFDRTGWPAGPWDQEPNRVDFKHAGFPCFVQRNWSGAWCGYVGVPPTHKLYKVPYQQASDYNVHGGLTYSNVCNGVICHTPEPGESDDVWWFGFDCHHSGDLAPKDQSVFDFMGYPNTYRNLDYVIKEAKSLAEQLEDQLTI